MTNAEMAAKYAATQTTPIQSKCPIIVQHVKKSDGHHYWFSHDGHKSITNSQQGSSYCDGLERDPECEKRFERYGRVVSSNGSRGYYATYVNFIEEYNCVELASIYMPGNVGKENEPREWVYDTTNYHWHVNKVRLFMFKGDKHLYDQNGNIWHEAAEGKYYNKDFRYFARELGSNKIIPMCEEEFTAFTKTKYFHVSSWSDSLAYPWGWERWYEKCTPRPTSKTQDSINKLMDAELAPLADLEKAYPLTYTTKEYTNYYGGTRKEYDFTAKDYAHFEIINDDYCVIRYLQRGYNRWESDKVEGHFSEPYRIYISADGKVSVTQLLDGEYRITSQQIKNIFGYYSKPKFGNLDQIKNWKRLSWIEGILTDSKEQEVLSVMVALLRHPILEIVYKAGYKNIFKMLINDYTVTNNLKSIFNIAEKKKGSVTKLLGCNKQTLKWIDENYEKDGHGHYNYVIACVKEIFGTNDISSWSQESIELYFKGAKALLAKSGYYWKYNLQLHCDSRWSWSREEEKVPLTPEEQKRCQKVLRTGAKDARIIELLVDTLEMYRRLTNKPDIADIYDVTSLSEMARYHDAIQEIHNQQEAERRAYWNAQEKERLEQDKKRFAKLQEDRVAKYNYTTDSDNYIIKVPDDLTEITNEGITLHHCVGSYLHRHAVGETNIIFLRQKELPTLPYYTIEVSNNHVVQIHGSCNKWLGAAKDALQIIPFVQKWLKKTGIHCDNKILLCQATGYCSGSDYLDGAQFGL